MLVCVYPLEVVRTRLTADQARNKADAQFKGVWDCITKTVHKVCVLCIAPLCGMHASPRLCLFCASSCARCGMHALSAHFVRSLACVSKGVWDRRLFSLYFTFPFSPSLCQLCYVSLGFDPHVASLPHIPRVSYIGGVPVTVQGTRAVSSGHCAVPRSHVQQLRHGPHVRAHWPRRQAQHALDPPDWRDIGRFRADGRLPHRHCAQPHAGMTEEMGSCSLASAAVAVQYPTLHASCGPKAPQARDEES